MCDYCLYSWWHASLCRDGAICVEMRSGPLCRDVVICVEMASGTSRKWELCSRVKVARHLNCVYNFGETKWQWADRLDRFFCCMETFTQGIVV